MIVKKIIVIFWGALIFMSCGSIPDVHYYMIDSFPTSTLNKDAKYQIFIGIENFKTDPLYDNDRIVYRNSQYEVKFYNYHRWVSPTTKIVTDKIIEIFGASGLFEAVVPFPITNNVDYLLQGTIKAFEEWDEQDSWYGKVNLYFQLIDMRDNSVVWQDVIGKKSLVKTKKPIDVVQALDTSLQSCIKEALGKIDKTLYRDF